jgi:hypothetical protein
LLKPHSCTSPGSTIVGPDPTSVDSITFYRVNSNRTFCDCTDFDRTILQRQSASAVEMATIHKTMAKLCCAHCLRNRSDDDLLYGAGVWFGSLDR